MVVVANVDKDFSAGLAVAKNSERLFARQGVDDLLAMTCCLSVTCDGKRQMSLRVWEPGTEKDIVAELVQLGADGLADLTRSHDCNFQFRSPVLTTVASP